MHSILSDHGKTEFKLINKPSELPAVPNLKRPMSSHPAKKQTNCPFCADNDDTCFEFTYS